MNSHSDKDFHIINKKILACCLIIIAIGIILIVVSQQTRVMPITNKITENIPSDNNTVNFITMIEGKLNTINASKNDLLFDITITYDNNNDPQFVDIQKKPELSDFYKQVGFPNASKDIVYVYPIFTQGAYGYNGFYNYYDKKCGLGCLTVTIPSTFIPEYGASMTASIVLSDLNYSHITDVDIDKNPDILKKFKKVIILHNEYVTKKEFDAITNHPNVLYLFPNALFAEVKTNYDNNTFTLIKGHGYPVPSIANGFNWKYDNSKSEYNTKCENMTFELIPNGKMLNCYPAYRTLFDKSLLEAIKEP